MMAVFASDKIEVEVGFTAKVFQKSGAVGLHSGQHSEAIFLLLLSQKSARLAAMSYGEFCRKAKKK
jgi:hypothetical protein